ncbi:hypothetical protein J7E93_09625, partial [Streptomyces sp. ISL-36]|nr:hypothetical protein [Streptomyces sp. ISL-36]
MTVTVFTATGRVLGGANVGSVGGGDAGVGGVVGVAASEGDGGGVVDALVGVPLAGAGVGVGVDGASVDGEADDGAGEDGPEAVGAAVGSALVVAKACAVVRPGPSSPARAATAARTARTSA